MPRVTFIFADGERLSCEAPAGQLILAAARAAGIALASDCEIGDCQTCRANLRSGRVEFDELAFITLEDEEIEDGAVLTCVSMAQEDAEIELPYVRSQLIAERAYPMTIVDVDRLSPSTARLQGKLPRNSPFKFHPGQYVNIKIPGSDDIRPYSMASDPAAPDSLEFHIRLLPSGQMSNFIRQADLAGRTLEIAGPKGVFYLRESAAPILMIAGGTGLAPMVSMLRFMAGTNRARQRVLLCFGVSRPDDLYFLDELERLKARLPGLTVKLAMAEPNSGWSRHKGFATDLVTPADLDGKTQVYLCGPPLMVLAARKLVSDCGVSDGAVFAEEFSPAGAVSIAA